SVVFCISFLIVSCGFLFRVFLYCSSLIFHERKALLQTLQFYVATLARWVLVFPRGSVGCFFLLLQGIHCKGFYNSSSFQCHSFVQFLFQYTEEWIFLVAEHGPFCLCGGYSFRGRKVYQNL